MIKFLTTNKLDSATVTSLSAASGHAATNVQSRFLKQTWRSMAPNPLTSQWLKFDLGSASLISVFTFFYNNLTSGATVKLYAHASDLGNTEASWSGATYNQTITNFDTRVGYIAPAQTLRYWFLAITDSSNTDGYVEIGRCFAGTVTSPSLNFNENFSETEIDPSEQSWTIGGHVYSTQRERYKILEYQFLDLAQADQTVLRTFFHAVYKTEPFVLLLDVDSEPVNLTRYGMLTSDLSFNWTSNNRINSNFSFRELR